MLVSWGHSARQGRAVRISAARYDVSVVTALPLPPAPPLLRPWVPFEPNFICRIRPRVFVRPCVTEAAPARSGPSHTSTLSRSWGTMSTTSLCANFLHKNHAGASQVTTGGHTKLAAVQPVASLPSCLPHCKQDELERCPQHIAQAIVGVAHLMATNVRYHRGTSYDEVRRPCHRSTLASPSERPPLVACNSFRLPSPPKSTR